MLLYKGQGTHVSLFASATMTLPQPQGCGQPRRLNKAALLEPPSMSLLHLQKLRVEGSLVTSIAALLVMLNVLKGRYSHPWLSWQALMARTKGGMSFATRRTRRIQTRILSVSA